MEYRNNDIEKYIKGELTAAEMHDLEQRALKDPFLAEALEGAEHAGAENFSLDIHKLQRTIQDKARRKHAKTISLNGWGLYVGIAAGLLLLAVSSFVIFTMIRQQQAQKQIAQNQPAPAPPAETKDIPGADSIQASNEPSAAAKEQAATDARQPRQESKPTVTGPLASAEIQTTPDRDSQPQREPESQDVHVADEGQAVATQPSITSGVANKTIQASIERVVKGKVVSVEDGSALAGVNVLIKGTKKGTVTDAEGKFELPVLPSHEHLVFSFIGLTSQELEISSQDQVSVKMQADPSQLSEVVVKGAGLSRDPMSPVIEMAEPEGGRNAFKKYLEEQLQYPKQALANQVEGNVQVQFTVQPNGQLSDFKILNGLGFGCDEEVIRLIKEGPAWEPSRSGDKAVTENVTIRLKFDLPAKK